jgi:uncharacterized protein DUF2809
MLTFNRNYALLTILLFAVETLIALYVHDAFVRPYFGDVLVVILIYFFVKSFLKISVNAAAILVLLFSYTIEVLQYFNLVEKLHLEKSELAKTVLGSSFSWLDIIAYTFGFILILVVEKLIKKRSKN